jgi:uncharacterized membrane protein
MTLDRNRTVIGLFENYQAADTTFKALERAGFAREQLHVLSREYVIKERLEEEQVEGALKDVAKGAVGGTAIGGLLGLLVGIGAIAIPGIGPVIAAGSITTALATAAGGATVGAVAGSLASGIAGRGLSEEDVQRYAAGLKQGGLLLIVHTDEQHEPLAAEILEQTGVVAQTTALYDPAMTRDLSI